MAPNDMTPSPVNQKRILANIARVAREHEKQDFRNFVSAVLTGRFVPGREFVSAVPVPVGAVLKATDRDYVMMRNGAYLRTTPKRNFKRDRKESQIFCPHWASKNKYPKNVIPTPTTSGEK